MGGGGIVNSHPGVSHNYLRNHDFNMWFTIAVEEDSQLGLQGTLDVLQELTGAESIRQLPTLKLFKIRMDLDMQGDTDDLARPASPRTRSSSASQPFDEFDRAVIRATQGDLPVAAEPYVAAAQQLGVTQRRARRAPRRHAGARAPAPRRRDPLPSPRRLQRQRDGRLAGTRGGDCRGRPAHGLVPRHQPLLPAPDVRGLAVLRLHDGPRTLQGGVRRDPRRDRGGFARSRTARRCTATEFKKVRLLYFTDDFGLGARTRRRLTVSLPDTRSAEALYRRALARLPGGVDSPVRAMRAIGRDPLFVARAQGAELVDVDGNRYVD